MIDDNRLFCGKYSYTDFTKAVLVDMLKSHKDRETVISYWKLDEIQDMIYGHFERFFDEPERYENAPTDELAFMGEVYSASYEQDLMYDPAMVN